MRQGWRRSCQSGLHPFATTSARSLSRPIVRREFKNGQGVRAVLMTTLWISASTPSRSKAIRRGIWGGSFHPLEPHTAPASSNRSGQTQHRKPGTANREPGTENREPATKLVVACTSLPHLRGQTGRFGSILHVFPLASALLQVPLSDGQTRDPGIRPFGGWEG